jgi:lipoyl(octanoyl) transferase
LEVREIVAAKFARVFERDVVLRSESIRLVKIVVHDGERVLLLHRRPERGNFWQPITGSIEEGELPLDTARRELIEETGHSGEPEAIDLEQSFMIESHFLAAKYPPPIIASEIGFAVEVPAGMPVRMDAAEHDDYGWFTFAEAYERIRWTDDREALEKVEARLSALAPQ